MLDFVLISSQNNIMSAAVLERQGVFPDQEMEKVAEISLTRAAFNTVLKRIKTGPRSQEAYLSNQNRRYAGEIAGYLHEERSLERIEDPRYELLGRDIGFFIAYDNTLLITEGTEAGDFHSDHKELIIYSILSPNIYNINGKITRESVIGAIRDSMRFVNKTKGWENLQLSLEKATDFVIGQNIKPEDLASYFK